MDDNTQIEELENRLKQLERKYKKLERVYVILAIWGFLAIIAVFIASGISE